MTTKLLDDVLDRCANDPLGPVAFHLQQEFLPVEGRGAVFYPPTFAHDEKYIIDTLADGTEVALVDSVGSQANRLEPIFLRDDLRHLVPQVTVVYDRDGGEGRVSLLEVGHRLGDALVRGTELHEEARAAFLALARGDATPIARLAPTSLVFGAWDSRDTGEKVPRLLQSVIRAWEVSRLSRSSTYIPPVDYVGLGVLTAEDESSKEKDKLSSRGFLHAPAKNEPGGIVANGPIRRDVTINLVALRRLRGESPDLLRRYVLGLSLVAAVEPPDPFLRQGCLLVPDPEKRAVWSLVQRDGTRETIPLEPAAVREWASEAARAFGVGPDRTFRFDKARAKADVAKAKKERDK